MYLNVIFLMYRVQYGKFIKPKKKKKKKKLGVILITNLSNSYY